MNHKLEQLAMVDIAEHLLIEAKGPLAIKDIFEKVATIKNFELPNVDRLTQLYMDMTQSAKFVYCGDDLWDLKSFNLELWDEDGSKFVKHEEPEEELEDDLEFEAYVLEDETEVKAKLEEDEVEELDEEAAEEKAYIEVELPIVSTDDDDDKDNELDIEFDEGYDEEDYNEIMDDYEDMYDK